MRYSHPQVRQTARRIPILCAIYFALFSFFWLFFLQRDLLAQTQFVMSGGTTIYRPVSAALLCTFLLTGIGGILTRLFSWLPLRMGVLAWLPSFILLGLLTHWHFPMLADAGSSPHWSVYLLLFFLFLLGLFLGRYIPDSSKENGTFSTYAWPNLLGLLLFSSVCVGISNTDIRLHRTLLSARCLEEGDYGRALRAARWETHPSRLLSAQTALALSERGILGDSLFHYPQPYGSEGLLPLPSDSVLFVDFPLAAGLHLGYKRGAHTRATFFLQVIANREKARPAVRQYLLSAHLLDKQLGRFRSELLHGDTLSAESLPMHYREALVLYQAVDSTLQPRLEDSLLVVRYEEFDSLRHTLGKRRERQYRVREQFANTYWYYYFFE